MAYNSNRPRTISIVSRTFPSRAEKGIIRGRTDDSHAGTDVVERRRRPPSHNQTAFSSCCVMRAGCPMAWSLSIATSASQLTAPRINIRPK